MRQPDTAVGGLGAIRRWPSAEARDWVRTFHESAATNPHVRVVVAIGSAVRHVQSSVDIDLVVGHDGHVPSFSSMPIDVDLRWFPVDRLRTLALDGHDLVGWAVNYGVPIIDKDGYWRQLSNEIADQIPLPSPSRGLRRAERAQQLLKQLVAAGDEDAANEQLLSFLTHLARARLAGHGVYPASRPELPQQLRAVGEDRLATALQEAIKGEASPRAALGAFELTVGTSPKSLR